MSHAQQTLRLFEVYNALLNTLSAPTVTLLHAVHNCVDALETDEVGGVEGRHDAPAERQARRRHVRVPAAASVILSVCNENKGL